MNFILTSFSSPLLSFVYILKRFPFVVAIIFVIYSSQHLTISSLVKVLPPIEDKNFIIPSANNYSTFSKDSYKTFLPSFKATNVELISKMKIALKENKQQEVMKIFEQMSDKAKQNVKSLVEKYGKYGLTLDNYVQNCIKQPKLFYLSSETVEKTLKS